MNAFLRQLSTSRQMQLYSRDALFRVILPGLRQPLIPQQQQQQHEENDEIQQLITDSHMKAHSSDKQRTAFLELLSQICNDLKIKHKLNEFLNNNNNKDNVKVDDQDEKTYLDTLYQKVFQKFQLGDSQQQQQQQPQLPPPRNARQAAEYQAEEKRRAKLAKERKEELQAVIKSFSSDSIEQCVQFLHDETLLFTSNYGGSISALRIQSLLLQLTAHDAQDKILESDVVRRWMQPVLSSGGGSGSGPAAMTLIRYMCYQWYTMLVSMYRALVTKSAQMNYVRIMQRRKREEEEQAAAAAALAKGEKLAKKGQKRGNRAAAAQKRSNKSLKDHDGAENVDDGDLEGNEEQEHGGVGEKKKKQQQNKRNNKGEKESLETIDLDDDDDDVELEDEDFDPEKAMFGDDNDKNKNKNEELDDPSSFDEENDAKLLALKQQLLNRDLLRSCINCVRSISGPKSVTSHGTPYRETVYWSYVVLSLLQLLSDALNLSLSQDRYEQMVDLLSVDTSLMDLLSDLMDDDMMARARETACFTIVDDKFRIDYREIVEHALYIVSGMLNFEHTTFDYNFLQRASHLVVKALYAFTDPAMDSTDEHNISIDAFMVSMSCYALAKIGAKSSKLTSQLINQYVLKQQQSEANLFERLVSLVKCRKPISIMNTNQRRPLVLNAYSALTSLLKCKNLLAQKLLAMELHDDQKKDYSLVSTIIEDIKGNPKDPSSWELRFAAMVLLKYYSLSLKPFKSAAPVFGQLVDPDVKLIDTMIHHLTNRNKQAKKGPKGAEDEGADPFMHQRYLLPSTLSALNSLFNSARENGDPNNIVSLKAVVSTNEDFQGILSFLTMMEQQKVETGIPYKFIMVLVAIFVVFLILAPIAYNIFRPAPAVPPPRG